MPGSAHPAHAGQSELLDWHARIGRPETTSLIHGEEKARSAFAAKLEGGRIEAPKMHQSYKL
jgi:metallo-beta-lactamase family protein